MTTNTISAHRGVQPPGVSGCNHATGAVASQRLGMTIDEAAVYSGIGRNTLRRLVGWGKLPVLHIGRKSIVRTDILERFMDVNQGCNLLDCEQVRAVDF